MVTRQRASVNLAILDSAAKTSQLLRLEIIVIQTRVLTVEPVFRFWADMTVTVTYSTLELTAKLTSVLSVMYTQYVFVGAAGVLQVT